MRRILFAWVFTSTLLFTNLVRECRGSKLPSKKSNKVGDLSYKMPRAANTPGNLFVDESCIDCDVCRWMCPSIFSRKGVKSIVHKQPEEDNDKLRAYAAMISCPVGSIRLHSPDPLVKKALQLLPAPIDPVRLPGVFHLGYHAAESFGAASFLIQRTSKSGLENENIMIDTPRFNERLAKAIEKEGGLSYLILTHKDDVHDHERWTQRFPKCKRVMHLADISKYTEDVEIKLSGKASWQLADDVTILHTPGHTAGSICTLVRVTGGENALFSGDHLAYSASRQGLDGFKRYNKGNEKVQGDSIRLLAEEELSFTWLIPGHGRMLRFGDDEERVSAILKAAKVFDEEDEGIGKFGVGYF